MATLADEIATYDEMRDYLEVELLGKWVVFHGRELVGNYADVQDAATEAVARFGRGPYLIRQVGAPPLELPPALQFRTLHAND